MHSPVVVTCASALALGYSDRSPPLFTVALSALLALTRLNKHKFGSLRIVRIVPRVWQIAKQDTPTTYNNNKLNLPKIWCTSKWPNSRTNTNKKKRGRRHYMRERFSSFFVSRCHRRDLAPSSCSSFRFCHILGGL